MQLHMRELHRMLVKTLPSPPHWLNATPGDRMTTEHSPTVAKLRLGMELRGLRLRAGRTMVEAADCVARTDSTISRLETGQVAISHRVLEKLLELYAAEPGQREDLRRLARQARRRGWWQPYAELLPPSLEGYLGLESEASAAWVYEPETVPAVLQTDDYTRAMLRAAPFPVPDHEIDGLLEMQKRRRALLAEAGGRSWHIALHEAVLHHRVGGPEVMHEQLRSLAAPAGDLGLTLQIVPFAAGAHAAMHTGGFTVLAIPLGDGQSYDVVHLEYRTGGLLLDRAAEVEEHRAAFRQLLARALPPDRSRQLISRVSQSMLTGPAAKRR